MKTILFVVQIVLLILNESDGFKLDSRIINGVPSYKGQFPYYTFMLIDIDEDNQQICGGAIIDKEWILTAAHCVNGTQGVSLVVGSWKLPDRNETRQFFKVDLSQIVLHANYSRKPNQNDIALIRLSEPIQFNKYVKPVKLSSKCESTENLDVLVVGNGIQDEAEDYKMPAVLQYTKLKTMTDRKCIQYYPFISSKQKICAGNRDGSSACYGDSGGPLIRTKDNALIGILNFTHKSGCFGGYPQVFSNIFYYYSWISEITSIKLPECQTTSPKILDFFKNIL